MSEKLTKYYYYVNWDKKKIIYFEENNKEVIDTPQGFVFLGCSDFPNKEIIVSNMIGKAGHSVVGYSMEELK